MLALPTALQALLSLFLTSALASAQSPLFQDQSSPSPALGFTPPSIAEQVYRFKFTSQAAQERLHARLSHLDIWRRTRTSLDVRLSRADLALLDSDGQEESDYEVVTMIEDVKELLKTPSISTETNDRHSAAAVANFTNSNTGGEHALRTAEDDPIHLSYHPYPRLVTILESLVADYPGYARMVTLGTSSEGRDIWAIQVGNFSHKLPEDGVVAGEEVGADEDEEAVLLSGKKKGKGRKKRKGITKKLGVVVLGTQHAREWIAASTSLYFVHSLLQSTRDPGSFASESLAPLLNTVTFTVIPVVNVDGYAYTWEEDRLWRKNRQDLSTHKDCKGIDLNRNWGFKWAPGTRPNPCSDSYPGSRAFEAPELMAVEKFMLDKRNNVVSFMDLHSFGQMLLFPYSFSCSKSTSDAEDLFEAVVGAAKALRSVHGRSFETGSVCEVSLSGPGDAIDWSYETAKVTWSFTIELRDLGVFGFLLPASQIVPSGQEITAALASLANFVVGKEMGKKVSPW